MLQLPSADLEQEPVSVLGGIEWWPRDEVLDPQLVQIDVVSF